MKKRIIFLILLCLAFTGITFAKIGVGVNTSEINISEPLRAGGMYDLPLLTVFNTGDESSYYRVRVEFHEDQPQLRPDREWFSFDPPLFYLESQEAKKVAIKVTLPFRTKPGDYFAYVEGVSAGKSGGGGAHVGVAAAAKLYFSVAPANIFQGIYYRIVALFEVYSPWSWIVLIIIIGAVLLSFCRIFFKKFFKLQIIVSKKLETESKGSKKNKQPKLPRK